MLKLHFYLIFLGISSLFIGKFTLYLHRICKSFANLVNKIETSKFFRPIIMDKLLLNIVGKLADKTSDNAAILNAGVLFVLGVILNLAWG